MPYSKFTLSKAVEDFQLAIVEGERFVPEVSPVNLSSFLKDTERGVSLPPSVEGITLTV